MLLLLCLRLSHWLCSLLRSFDLVIDYLLDEMAVLALNWSSRAFWCRNRGNVLLCWGRPFLWARKWSLSLLAKVHTFCLRIPWSYCLGTVAILFRHRFFSCSNPLVEQLWITDYFRDSLKHIHVLVVHVLSCCFRLFQGICLSPLIFSKLLHRTRLFFKLQSGWSRLVKRMTLPLPQEEVLLCSLGTLLWVLKLLFSI